MRTLAAHAVLPALAGVLMLVSAAGAETELLAGKRLALRQGVRGERLSVVSRDQLVAPLPGGTDDPTLMGAVLEIGNPATGEWARFQIPAAGWSLNALGTVFRFQAGRQRALGAVRALVIRHGKRLKVSGTAVGLSLDERTQGGLAVILTMGSRRYCMLFGGPSVRRDEPRRFAARNATAPASCPVPPVPTSTTSTTSTTSPTSLPVPASTSTSSSTSAPAPTIVTTSTSSTSSSTRRPTASTSTSSSSSSSTSSLPLPTTTSTSSTSTTSTSTSSTTSTTGFTCGGFAVFCGGTCPPGQRCIGGLITACRCDAIDDR